VFNSREIYQVILSIMAKIPHPDEQKISVNFAVVTVSDTRTPETDKSGLIIKQLLENAGHNISFYTIIKDEPLQIKLQLEDLGKNPEIQAIVYDGGTGIAPRDTTYDALATMLEKTLPGFGEIFRSLSYQEIGTRAIATRAIAGIYQGKIVFSIPGSSGAVKLATDSLIIPEINHLVKQLAIK
jgi:molybdopterin adenylyltransferase